MIDYYKKGFYKTIYLVKDIERYESSFMMWDHFKFGPYQKAYEFLRNQHKLFHGLTIIQQHGAYCDFFLFATYDRNATINNFYLNNKELFLDFIERFYEELKETIEDVSRCRIELPIKQLAINDAPGLFSPRQLECGRLVTKGLTSKEIARELKLSPRTVEDYIHILKKKSGAKNRAQLVYYLSGLPL
jgi:DNA-binding CsgD family transcriptional regulator